MERGFGGKPSCRVSCLAGVRFPRDHHDGRDGSNAVCTLLYSGQDVRLNAFLIEKEEENPLLTEEQARDILAKFSAEDINRIIAQIDNKGAYKNKSAYSTFASFVAHDFIIKSRKATTGRKYTYNEMCDEVYSRRASSDDFQMFQMPDGTKYWQRKIDMTGPQA